MVTATALVKVVAATSALPSAARVLPGGCRSAADHRRHPRYVTDLPCLSAMFVWPFCASSVVVSVRCVGQANVRFSSLLTILAQGADGVRRWRG